MRSHLLSGGLVLALAASAAPAPAQADILDSGYRPGKGLSWASADGRFKLGLSGRLQIRYTYQDFDELRGRDELSDFTAERIRFAVSGHVFDHWEYKFQTDWGKGDEELKDAVINYAQFEEFQVAIGQFKIHHDQQQFISSSRLHFVDRSLAAREFGISRDVGIALHGDVADGRFTYNAGIYDGEGDNARNPNDGHLYAVHFGFHPNGPFGYYEGSVKDDEEPRWFISLAAAWNEDLLEDLDGDKAFDELIDMENYTGGFGFRNDRVFLMGEYYMREMEVDSDSDAMPWAEVDSDGFYLQLGVMLGIDEKWEIAGRYSEVDWDEDDLAAAGFFSSDSTIGEEAWTLAVNRYFWDVGHALKIQGDVSLLEEELYDGTDLDDWRVRLQAQLVF